MDELKAKLTPLPKAIHSLALGQSDAGPGQTTLACGTVARHVLLCPVVQPELSVEQREGLLRVSGHLAHALEKVETALGLSATVQPTYTIPRQAFDSPRDIDTIYLVLAGAPEEADEVDPRIAFGAHLLARAMETKAEGYTLRVDGLAGMVEITGRTSRGVFYGVQTLLQLLRASNVSPCGSGEREAQRIRLPLVLVADQPDFSARGVMLDVSRDKVPTLQTLKMIVDELAALKINQLQLYMEHTFAYRGHEEVWKDASPYTVQDILELDSYCRERFIELVPNQNSFGHFHRWLKHDSYRKYAEVPEGNLHPFLAVGDDIQKEPFGLAPDDQSIKLLDDLYSQLLPNFASSQFNVGCDETFDLGQGKSKDLCEEKGVQLVYIEFLNRVHDLVSKKYRKKMQYWGDIVLQRPEMINLLPKDAISLIWGYESNHPFDKECKAYADLKEFPFYVCPGTSAWNTITGRTDNAILNLVNAAHNGHAHGAVGYLITDWGDNGHWQTLPISYLGYMVGAGLAWNAEASDRDSYLSRENIATRLSMHLLRDCSNTLGRVLYDLGCLYTLTGGDEQYNSTCIFRYLQKPTEEAMKGIGHESATGAHAAIHSCLHLLKEVRLARTDSELVVAEIAHGAAMADVSCRAMALVRHPEQGSHLCEWRDLQREWDALRTQHEAIWLRRNRSGGLQDSVKRFVPFARFLADKLAQ